MTWDIAITLSISIIAVALFISEKIRMDAVAILVLATLALLDIISVQEALSGFSNSATVAVAAMFVLAAGLQNSGALDGIAQLLSKAKSPLSFLLILFALVALISPFVNNTAVVAVFIPIVMAAAKNIKLPTSKALIPLSFVSQMAGVTTLIGTSTNLLVNAIAVQQGHPGFGIFDFVSLGLIFLVVGCAYILLLSPWLLPERTPVLDEQQDLGKYVAELKISADSPLIGQTTADLEINQTYKVYLLGLLRLGQHLTMPSHQALKENDILLIRGQPEDLMRLRDKFNLQHSSVYHHVNYSDDKEHNSRDIRMVEVMITSNSKWLGSNTLVLSSHWNRNIMVWGLQRRGKIIRDRLRNISLRVGDILLMTIPQEDMSNLRQDPHFIVLSEGKARSGKNWRAWFALLTMVAVVLVSALGWASIAITALLGAAAMTMAGCLSAEESYDSIDWRIIILLAGLIPLGQAMANSGAAEFIVRNTVGQVGDFGPLIVLAVLYLMTSILTEFMSNAGTAVLMTPIALSTAQMLGVDASPYLIAVMFAAATSFMTPVGYQTNTMVYAAGGYHFTDFIKIGLPLNVLYWILAVILIPVFWPF
ncbi:MAG: SLC13 family permease [Pelistega sp.]|nr:SLC13 family permease [Pelistega sp.]